MESGEWYPRAPLVRHTHGPGCSLWLTPTAWLGRSLDNAYCGPRAYRKQETLTAQVGDRGSTGWLNPEWVEWLMGFPIGWTDSEGWATPLFPRLPSTLDGS